MGQTASSNTETEVVMVYAPTMATKQDAPDVREAGGAGYRVEVFTFSELARLFREGLRETKTLAQRSVLIRNTLQKWYRAIAEYEQSVHTPENKDKVYEASRTGIAQDMYAAILDQVLATYEQNQTSDSFNRAIAPFARELSVLRAGGDVKWLGGDLMTDNAWLAVLQRYIDRDNTLEVKWKAFYKDFQRIVESKVSACSRVNLDTREMESIEQGVQELCRLRQDVLNWQPQMNSISADTLRGALETVRGYVIFINSNELYARVLRDLDALLADAVLRYVTQQANGNMQAAYVQLSQLAPPRKDLRRALPYLSSLDELLKQHLLRGRQPRT